MAKYLLTDEDKALWFDFIEEQLGLVLPNVQDKWLENKITQGMLEYGLSASVYFEKIKADVLERQKFVDSVMIGETQFFRHQPSYDFLATYLAQCNEMTSIWSVGCASGEEAWSIAMVASELLSNYKVLASDVSKKALMQARQSVYDKSKLKFLPAGYLQTYFKPCTDEQHCGQYAISNKLKHKVQFVWHNLLGNEKLPIHLVDVIFCQNVLIYFRQFDQRDILNTLVDYLTVGGVLILAPGEARTWQNACMRKLPIADVLVYQKMSC